VSLKRHSLLALHRSMLERTAGMPRNPAVRKAVR
jgi:hypothetical protein